MAKYYILFTLLTALACTEDKSLDVNMTDESLVALIEDIHLANSLVIKYKTYERDSVNQILRAQMAEIHGVSEEGIDYVMEQLQLSPIKYLELEKKAVENLKALKDSLKSSLTVQKKK